MTDTILQLNAVPIYGFLSSIAARQSQGELGDRIRVLDCGAGGAVPPLALFSEHGFDAYGIDVSDRQLERARQYCEGRGIQVDLRTADMRQIPHDDGSFDCVYEHYAMCHLSKLQTAVAIGEMHRVTRSGGLCFLGVISMDSWPKSLYGTERGPGEYWVGEDRHCMFTDAEADELVSAWEVLSKEKRVIYLRDALEDISEEAWMDMRDRRGSDCSEAGWRDRYSQRANMANYTHVYYILRKQ